MGQRFFPLDRALGLLRGAYTPQVQEAITRLSSRMSYREAHQELGLLWKVDISKGSMQQVTMRHGRVANTLIKDAYSGENDHLIRLMPITQTD